MPYLKLQIHKAFDHPSGNLWISQWHVKGQWVSGEKELLKQSRLNWRILGHRDCYWSQVSGKSSLIRTLKLARVSLSLHLVSYCQKSKPHPSSYLRWNILNQGSHQAIWKLFGRRYTGSCVAPGTTVKDVISLLFVSGCSFRSCQRARAYANTGSRPVSAGEHPAAYLLTGADNAHILVVMRKL